MMLPSYIQSGAACSIRETYGTLAGWRMAGDGHRAQTYGPWQALAAAAAIVSHVTPYINYAQGAFNVLHLVIIKSITYPPAIQRVQVSSLTFRIRRICCHSNEA